MNCRNACFPATLHYESPAHGGWGLVRMAALLPEMHMLFLIPPACGRHSALGSIMNGIKDKVSYLFYTEEEIVNGTYLDRIGPAVDSLLEMLSPRPRAILLFGGCIDDLLGTDFPSVVRELESAHPDIHFRYCHMDPIQLGGPNPPGITLFTYMYSILEKPQENARLMKNHVNLIGNNLVVDPGSEFMQLFASNGIEVHQLPACKKWEDFTQMAGSCLNIVLSPRCIQAAKAMQEKLGIPYMVFLPTYCTQEIEEFYMQLCGTLDIAMPFDAKALREKADSALGHAAEVLDGYPVAIDFQAVTKPVSLAKVLVQNGFNVRLLAIDGVSAFDQPAFEYLKEHFPDIEVSDPLHHSAPKMELRSNPDILCIGSDCAFMTGSVHIADIQEDGKPPALDTAGFLLSGFRGVEILSGLIVKAFENQSNVMQLIKEANLVI